VLGAATSADANYNGRNPADVGLSNQDNDTAGVTVSARSPNNQTSENLTSVSFTIKLDSEPTANVTIGLSTSDATEGSLGVVTSVTFTPADWSVPQTVTVTGVDDSVYDGNITYTIVTAAASSSDPLYSGRAVADVSLVNLDNDPPPPTKFYVVDDGTTDRTFEYTETGGAIENYALTGTGNTASRGAAMTSAGDKVWVVDRNRNVYVYNTSGVLQSSWTAGTLASTATVEGIATDGTNIWIVDAKSDRIFYYAGAAVSASGTVAATGNWALGSGNTGPKDVVWGSDSTKNYLWIVNDASTDKVFRYVLNANGSIVTSTTGADAMISWNLNTANKAPTGITLDPTQTSGSLWVVDSGTDRIYEYTNARGNTAGTFSPTFYQLSATNTNPQGIADPPPSGNRDGSVSVVADLLGASLATLQPSTGQVVTGTQAIGASAKPTLISATESRGVRWDARAVEQVSSGLDSVLDALARDARRKWAEVGRTSGTAQATDALFGDARNWGEQGNH
jgi:hypothetical protein